MLFLNIFLCLTAVYAGPATENYKGQFCTDPRTMRKHAAYTEWADAYSCTRHRCQPGGRNLAIYTVGCKRVEAPESAIECEEVVEDTNMQFPYCCTRLRCLVVVRGEVWTRVLGQPWETLPAAPWSHMYKMKKPPPADGTFLPKSPGEGPIYELQTEADNNERDKVLRAKGPSTETAEYNDVAPRANAAPDIVIALSTNSDLKASKKDTTRHKRGRKTVQATSQFLEDDVLEPRIEEPEEPSTEKPLMEPASDERYYANAYGVTQKVPVKMALQRDHHQPQPVSWTEIPQNQWNEHHEPSREPEQEITPRERTYHQPEYPVVETEKKEEKPALQALVDAIGTRMRDIESVVQRMSEKVTKVKPPPENDGEFAGSSEKRTQPDTDIQAHKHHSSKELKEVRVKKPNPDGEHYKRFSKHGSKYIHGTSDITTELPLFVEDSKLTGYFSDASNTMVRRSGSLPKEPAATYMAPVDNRRKAPAHISVVSDASDETEKKHKKHAHKKKHAKANHHKKHHAKDDKEKRKRFNRLNSVELDRNTVSIEDSSAGAASN